MRINLGRNGPVIIKKGKRIKKSNNKLLKLSFLINVKHLDFDGFF